MHYYKNISNVSEDLKTLLYDGCTFEFREPNECGICPRTACFTSFKRDLVVNLVWSEDIDMCFIAAETYRGHNSFRPDDHHAKKLSFKETAIFMKLLKAYHEDAKRRTIPKKMAHESVSVLGVNRRISNVLGRIGIKTIGGLVSIKPSDMLRARNFGEKSLPELKAALSAYGIYWSEEEVKIIDHD